MEPSLPLLSTMLGGLSLEKLVSEHWDRRPLHVSGPPERLCAIADREALLSRVRSAKNATVAAYFPDPGNTVTLREGVRPVLRIGPDQVDGALAAGAGIAVKNLAEIDDRVAAWMREMRRELGFVGRVECAALLGTSFAPHFDTSSVITVQLRGRKTWRVSRAPAVTRPAAEAIALPDGACVYQDRKGKAVRREEWELEAKAFDPASSDDYELAPGDMLFVPAGCWHMTTSASDEHTLSLSISFVPVDLCAWIAGAFEPVLRPDPAWRHLPPQPGAGGEMPAALRAFLAARLAELSKALAAPGAVDWVLHRAFKRSLAEPPACMAKAPAAPGPGGSAPRDEAPIDPGDVLAVRDPLRWTFVDTRDAEGRPVVEIFTGQREILFDEPDLLPFGRELGRRTRFVAGEATGWAGEGESYPWEQVQEMLAALVDEGAIAIEARVCPVRHGV